MNVRHYLQYALAMALAYGAVLLLPLFVDYAFDTNTEVMTVVWLNIGLGVMQVKRIPFPTPDRHRIDVGGGLKVLWWALFWPSYLRRR